MTLVLKRLDSPAAWESLEEDLWHTHCDVYALPVERVRLAKDVEVDEEPEAQVLSERELMLLVAPDAAPQDLPAPEPEADEPSDDAG